MELVNPKVEYHPQAEGLEGVFKQIEIAGRTCYKSEDKITEDSARKFVDKMIASKHNAMLAHGTVYLKIPFKSRLLVEDYIHNQFSTVAYTNDDAYITTNYRVIVENNLDHDLDYLCSPTQYHEQRFTFKITSDRAILNEAVRNNGVYRNAFAQESTRWIDYFKKKGIAVSIAFVKPYWYDEANWFKKLILRSAYKSSELFYKLLRKLGCTPQQARVVLVLGLKSELVMTAMLSDWEDFLDKRLKGTTGAPHPDMKLIAAEIEKELNLIYEKQLN